RRSVFALGVFANPFLVVSVAAAQALHISAMYIPGLRDTLQLAPISPAEWTALLLVASSVLVVMEFDKWRRRCSRTEVSTRSSA
ncbi:MAG: cation-translocating P-type ATPase C-terminal domain-containing protein, partial [Pararhizobium sp.]